MIGDSWYLRFHDLMPFRVREILVVSSPYDAFILEEDGRLTARLFMEYSELHLSQAPRITHVPTGTEAMALLQDRHFDLVITMVHLADMDVTAFASQIKAKNPRMPVVLLAFTEADLARYLPEREDWGDIDRVFLWTGDTRILIAAIKSIEDERNVRHDTRNAGVRVIIVVEDSIRRYSSFLSMLYGELLTQAASLIAEGVNDLHKLLRMRARPRILLATTYERAIAYYEEYRPYLFTVISDVRFPRGGTLDPEAGFALMSLIRQDEPDLPMLLQSAEPALEERARALQVQFVQKNAPSLLRDIGFFFREGLGFGPFIFRLEDKTEVGRAEDMFEMEQVLHTVPAESIAYHATRNHFSLWLMARSMFRLAQALRPRTLEEFGGIEGMRAHLIEILGKARQQEHAGAITDFAATSGAMEGPFIRVGQGSIGGKGRSIAFAGSILARHGLQNRFEGLEIRVPRTVGIGTDVFDRFLEDNDLGEAALSGGTEEQILERFLAARLPSDRLPDLQAVCNSLVGPIAVRSSSLLEDAHIHAFAGIYSTFMLPNNHPDPEVRLYELCQAIKAVYASTFAHEARAYIGGTPHSLEEERMGVVVQQVVGQQYGERFYPHFSGVAASYNYYPIGGQRADEGIAAVALGLGHMVVTGGKALRFSPAQPTIQAYTDPKHLLAYAQQNFYALDVGSRTLDFRRGPDASLRLYDLKDAEDDGTLHTVGSVYVAADDVLRDSLDQDGPRVVTFNNILKWQSIPLPQALHELLGILRHAIGYAVELEFALDIPRRHDGRPTRPVLYVLQIRPQAAPTRDLAVSIDDLPTTDALCESDMSLGHGIIDDIRDIVYVKPEALEGTSTKAVAFDVGMINAKLEHEGRSYFLIGPGRWGSSDPRLGIPVEWSQISAARLIAETPFVNLRVEPSQGSHFFHNITSLQVGYLALSGFADAPYDRAWLDGLPAVSETDAVRHVRVSNPIIAYLDGRQRRALVLKAAADLPDDLPSHTS